MEHMIITLKSLWHIVTDPLMVSVTIIISTLKAYWTHDGNWFKSAISWTSGIVSAYIITDPALHYLELDPATYRYFVAGVAVLTGENLMKWAVKVSVNPTDFITSITNLWRKP